MIQNRSGLCCVFQLISVIPVSQFRGQTELHSKTLSQRNKNISLAPNCNAVGPPEFCKPVHVHRECFLCCILFISFHPYSNFKGKVIFLLPLYWGSNWASENLSGLHFQNISLEDTHAVANSARRLGSLKPASCQLAESALSTRSDFCHLAFAHYLVATNSHETSELGTMCEKQCLLGQLIPPPPCLADPLPS